MEEELREMRTAQGNPFSLLPLPMAEPAYDEEGNTYTALSETARQLEKNGIETEILWIGTKAVRGCIACGKCRELGMSRCARQT